MKALSCGIFLCFFLFFVSPCLSKLCNQNDKSVLLEIKKSLKDPSFLSSWDPTTDCCTNWTSIQCSSITTAKSNNVIGLSLFRGDNNDIPTAKIPAEIGNLPFLKTLDLQFLNLTGTIPETISKLKHLEALRIIGTNISGSIPEFVGEFKKLRQLDLSGNKFTGRIPSSISSIPNIDIVRLARNQLTGSIPKSFGNFKNTVREISLNGNQLSGTIPKSLSKSSFVYVNVNDNKLRGDLSMFLGLNKTTQTVYASRNKLEFDFSKMKIQKRLQYLFIDRNRIFGKIPQDLTTHLMGFDFSYNRLCGKIPVGGIFQKLGPILFAHNRCLCGAPLERQC